MLYARINLSETNYQKIKNCVLILEPDINELQKIYADYCKHKKFKSVMPIFDSEFTDTKNDILGYYVDSKLVAFSIIRKYDNENIEAIQFAWNYEDPKLRLGIISLQNECAYYKELNYKYLYLGEADEYKKKIDGFEILGPV